MSIVSSLWGKVIDKGGSIIQELVTDKDLAKKLEHEFRALMSTQTHEFKTFELEVERDMYAAQQKTIQAELHQNDVYTKRTRPIIARRSFYAGLGYALLTSLPSEGFVIGFLDWTFATLMPWQFEWAVLSLLYSPALTYMGVRGFEKWKNGGSK